MVIIFIRFRRPFILTHRTGFASIIEMEEHIALQLIDEPAIQTIDLITGEETLQDNRTDLQSFLEAWSKEDMDPDKFGHDTEIDEDPIRGCKIRARQHFEEALNEFRFIKIIIEQIISASHFDATFADTSSRELANPDIPLGSIIIDKQLQLQSFMKFFYDSANEIRVDVALFRTYFRRLIEISYKFPVIFNLDQYRFVRSFVATIPSDPVNYNIPWIILQINKKLMDLVKENQQLLNNNDNNDNENNRYKIIENENNIRTNLINWKLCFPMYFLVNGKNVFFDSTCQYARLTSRVLLQYLFLLIRNEMKNMVIDYAIESTSTEVTYTTGSSTLNIQILPELPKNNDSNTTKGKKSKHGKGDKNKSEDNEKSDLCPPFIPAMVSLATRPKAQPFKTYKELIDEKILIDNAVSIIFARFLKSDFCEVKHVQRKRGVVIQIDSLFGSISNNSGFVPQLFKKTDDYEKFVHNFSSYELFDRLEPYHITVYLANNHFCGNDPKRMYSYSSIDLRSRNANTTLQKWCESHYFRMLQFTVAAVASRFGYPSKIKESEVSVSCGKPRKMRIFTTGKGDLETIVTHGDFRWKTKWQNLPIHDSVKKIEYLFFFNFSNK